MRVLACDRFLLQSFLFPYLNRASSIPVLKQKLKQRALKRGLRILIIRTDPYLWPQKTTFSSRTTDLSTLLMARNPASPDPSNLYALFTAKKADAHEALPPHATTDFSLWQLLLHLCTDMSLEKL